VVEPKSVTRREFLNYVWGASMALFLVQFGGLSFFFALPRPRVGEFGGIIKVDVAQYQEAADQKAPIANNVGKFWIVNTEAGINALYKVCTHLGCIYPWSDAAGIFACPCHGSQFKLTGDYIAGPAPRSLDRFQFTILDAAGNVVGTSTDKGEAVPLPANAATIMVDSGKKITGKSHL
jgi:cytochrome b6-f complex iron-sulfur subunit